MLILASKSPARKALLANAGLSFSVASADIDERTIETEALGKGLGSDAIATALATAKATAISRQNPTALVIGADQILSFGGALLHKPSSRSGARAQLLALRGKSHTLHSAVALASGGQAIWTHVERAELTMRPFSDRDLDAVLALEGDAVLDSVGAYRLEGPSIQLFDTISGNYFAILGLPLLPLLAALREHGPVEREAA